MSRAKYPTASIGMTPDEKEYLIRCAKERDISLSRLMLDSTKLVIEHEEYRRIELGGGKFLLVSNELSTDDVRRAANILDLMEPGEEK